MSLKRLPLQSAAIPPPPILAKRADETILDRLPSPHRTRGRIVAVLNPRAETGKTSLAVHIAAALAKSKRATLVIDLDPQANATRHLGVSPTTVAPTITDALARPDRSPGIHLRPIEQDLWLIPSSLSLSALEYELGARGGHELILRSRSQGLRQRFEHIVIDCPSSLGLLSVNALCAADTLLVPVCGDDLSFQGLDNLLGALKRVASRIGIVPLDARIVLTRYKADRDLALAVREGAKTRSIPIFQTFIRESALLDEARRRGCTIFAHAPHGAGAEDYLNLAREYSV